MSDWEHEGSLSEPSFGMEEQAIHDESEMAREERDLDYSDVTLNRESEELTERKAA